MCANIESPERISGYQEHLFSLITIIRTQAVRTGIQDPAWPPYKLELEILAEKVKGFGSELGRVVPWHQNCIGMARHFRNTMDLVVRTGMERLETSSRD